MILVTGGTGFVGRHLIKRLLSEGHAVRCLVRQSSTKIDRLREFDVEIVNGDITDADAITRAAEGCNAFYSLVGLLYEPGGYSFRAVHSEGIKNVVRACKEKNIRRLIHISALGVSPTAESMYHKTKFEGEETIKSSGLNYTIFRPSVIFGEDDSFVNLFAPMIRKYPFFGIIGDGRYKMQPVYIEDLVSCMVKALSDKDTFGEIYEIGGGEALSFNEVIEGISDALGKKTYKFRIPVSVARLSALVMEFFPRPLLTRDQLVMLLSDNVCDKTKAEDKFGIAFKKFRHEIRNFLP